MSSLPSDVTTGIYYGWAKLEKETEIRKAVVSIGWNPYYKNVKKSVVSYFIEFANSLVYSRPGKRFAKLC